MAKCSTIDYIDLDGDFVSVEVPTIQSISVPDSTTVPSKPTVTGEFRNQYVAASPKKVVVEVWLENGIFGGNLFTVREFLDDLEYIKDNHIKFSISATAEHEQEESRFLSNLVIENINYSRDASRRGRLVCTINCTEVKFVDLVWKRANAVEIFGHNIFTDATKAPLRRDFVPALVGKDFEIGKNIISAGIETAEIISGLKDKPIPLIIRDAIEDKVPLTEDSIYFKLSEPINMASGTSTYNCNCSFKTKYLTGISGKSYTVNVADFVIDIKQKESTLARGFPLAYVYAGKGIAMANLSMGLSMLNPASIAGGYAVYEMITSNTPTTHIIYDFANTYRNYPLSSNFEYVEPAKNLTEYVTKNKDIFSSDEGTIGNGNIIFKDGFIYTYKIADMYDYTVKFGDTFSHLITPSGGLDTSVYGITTKKDGFKPVCSVGTYQSAWDNLFTTNKILNYQLYVVPVTVGTLLQIYLFSAKLFDPNLVNYSS